MTQVGAEAPVTMNLYDGTKRFDAASGDLTDEAVKAQIAKLVKELEAAAAAFKAAAASAGAAAQ